MQSAAPQAVDLSSESEATKKLYGMHEEITEKFGATAYRQNDRRSADGSNGSRSSGSDSRSLRRRVWPNFIQREGERERLQSVGIYDVVRRRRESVIDRHAHVHDIHATMLHLMGLNHINLTYLHNGRAERPTIVSGNVIKELLA